MMDLSLAERVENIRVGHGQADPVCNQPCFLYSVVFYNVSATAITATFYDGFDNSAPIVFRVGYNNSANLQTNFGVPLFFSRGLFIEFSAAGNCGVQFLRAEQAEGL